jgi:hypothetical protein
MPVGQLAQGAEYPGDCRRAAMKHPTQGDLLPGPGRGFGESKGKLLNQGIPCRYQRSNVHADFSDVLRDTNYIGMSASFLSAQNDLKTG